MSDPTPLEALANIRQARAAVAERMPVPWPYDLAFALAVGGVFAASVLPLPLGPIAAGACVGGVTWLSVIRRDRSGVWPKSGGPHPARAVAIAMYLILAALLPITFIASMALDERWPALVAGAVAFGVTFVFSRWWAVLYCKALAAGER